MLSFTLLGQVVLSNNGTPVSQFRSQKETALLVYLAQTGQAHQRDFIAELFWNGRTTQQSLSNLRTTLTRLRKQVGDALLVTRKTLALAPESQQQVDSLILLQTLATVKQVDTAEKASTLQHALETYRGDFLPDFDLSDAPQFNEWVITTREHIRRQVIAAYDKLGQYALATEDYGFGLPIARRWLQIDELDEAAHTLLIHLLLKAGNTREALAHYEKCTELLQTELGIAPPAKLTALIQAAQPKRALAVPSPLTMGTAVRHNLPATYDQFFGRKADQQEIHVRLDQPWCRLVTITGQGGMGKTRLALTIAHSRLSQYRDGVWLVDLTNIDPDDHDLTEAIAVEIAIILDLRLTGSDTPIEQLLNHLQHQQMMIVLDNFEHLLDGIQIVLDLVQRCANVQLLVTSREALQLRAEWTIALTGLDYPTGDTDEQPSDAVELFVARQAQQQHGTLSADDLVAIRTICRLVEGLPLAIELAAALTRYTTPQAVADSLCDDLDSLTTSLRDVPERHRSLNIVFEMSWQTLTATLQTSLARLAVFRGGFTLDAAQQIAQANNQHLAALIEKSLLTYNSASDRYILHPVIRAYAAEKRSPTDPTPQKHAEYFLTLLAEHTEPIQKNRPQDSISTLEPDIDNIRLAWQTGLAEHQVNELYAALTALSTYDQLRGLAHEGESIMKTTVSTATAWGSDGTALATRAGLEQVRFQNRLGRYRPAIKTIKSTLKLAANQNDRWAIGMGHVLWGESLWRLAEYESAKNKLTYALDIAKALDATMIIGWCQHHLGIIHDIQSQCTEAHDYLKQACIAWRALDNAQALSGSLNSIGLVYYNQGDFSSAQQAIEQALAISEQMDDRHRQSSLVNNLSMILTEQGDYTGAQYYLQFGLKLAIANGNLTGQGEIYINLGKTYCLHGDIDLAMQSLEQGLKIVESIENQRLIATALLYLAESEQERGNLEGAESFYSQALKVAQQNNLQPTECAALIGMAELLSENDIKQAKQCSAKAIELAEAIQNSTWLKRANAIDHYLSVSTDLNKQNLS